MDDREPGAPRPADARAWRCQHGYVHEARDCPMGCYLVDELEEFTNRVCAFYDSKLAGREDPARFVGVFIHLGKIRALLEYALGLRP